MTDAASHQPVRIRRETRRRRLTVVATEPLGDVLRRITLASDDLADFDSAAADDHIKLFLPGADGQQAKRDYTPHAFDRESGRLVIDFALHDAGAGP